MVSVGGWAAPNIKRTVAEAPTSATEGALAPFAQFHQSMEVIQRRQLELQEKEFELRRRSQEAEIELRRKAIDRADANEKAANAHLIQVDQARIDFAKRGQTFAMWLAAIVTGSLLTSGLVCVFLAVVGAIGITLGVTAGGILLAGGLIAGFANLIGRFLPPDKGS